MVGKKKIAVILLFAFLLVNEVYRFLEISRLNDSNCTFAGVQHGDRDMNLTPSRVLHSKQYVYRCSDGTKKFSRYRTDMYVRPWE